MKITSDISQPQMTPQAAEAKPEPTADQTPAQGRPGKNAPKRARAADRVELSPVLTSAKQSHQELRAARIAAIKAQIENGSYRVDAKQVAEKMLADPHLLGLQEKG